MIIDLHVNAARADGHLWEPREILDRARDGWLDGMLVVGKGALPDTAAWLDARTEDDPLVFFAAEIATSRARFICIPRSLGGKGAFPKGLGEGLDEERLLEKLRALAAGVIVAQPYERTRPPTPGDLVFSFPGIHALETRTQGSDALASDLAMEAALGMGLPCVGGSDAPGEDVQLGHISALFLDNIESQSALVAALTSGDVWVVRGERPGGKRRQRRKR